MTIFLLFSFIIRNRNFEKGSVIGDTENGRVTSLDIFLTVPVLSFPKFHFIEGAEHANRQNAYVE